MNKKLQLAREEHEKYLRDMGVHPDQLKEKRKMGNYFGSRKKPAPVIEEKVFLHDISSYSGTGKVRGILANIRNEPEHVQAKIRKLQSRVMPLYNKGGLQLAIESEDMTVVGSRSRR